MNVSKFFNSKECNFLIGYDDKFDYFKNLISNNNLPKIILLSGAKGNGKATLVSHLLHYYFDKKNYIENKKYFNTSSSFHIQFLNNLFPNIFYFDDSNDQGFKIDDVRTLKYNLTKTSFINDKRFVILDDVETFNHNSLNALLKIIEEPGINTHFILINNKSMELLDTIKSRTIEFKIFLSEKKRHQIISSLLDIFNQKISLDKDLVEISPGQYLRYNYFFQEKKIDINDNFSENLRKILNSFKKGKNTFSKNLLLFFIEYHFELKKSKNLNNKIDLLDNRSTVIKNINNYFLYNLNQKTLINSIEELI